ncbi:MAG: 6-carboxytetrahydropterin synthase [Candidatus Kapabacteria bacterium]|nr:6-carboxytetrahydropterin synthase [Candidatus Kapabacteria bacterium]
MIIKIAKEFKWEMSHRLTFHKGPCKNIHGHTYRLLVEISGVPDENGMVMDYYDLEAVVNPLVMKLDHSFLCDENDQIMLDFLKANDFKYYVIPLTTTAENMARYLLEYLLQHFKKFQNLKELKIRFQETEDVYAEVSHQFA